MTEGSTEFVETMLSNGESIYVEAIRLGGNERVASRIPSFREFTDGVEAVAQEMVGSLEKIQPRSASIELNFEIGVGPGELKALLVRGAGTASVRLTLDYSGEETYRADDVEELQSGFEKGVGEVAEGAEHLGEVEGKGTRRIGGSLSREYIVASGEEALE